MYRRPVRLVIATVLLSSSAWLFLYYKQNSNYQLTKLQKDYREITRSTYVTNVFNGSSYSLWKSLRLPLYHQKGNATHRRYGERLELYSVSQTRHTKPTWSFHQSSGTGVDCARMFMNNGNILPEKQTQLAIQLYQNFQTRLEVAKLSCNDYISNTGYVTSALSEIEATFPIAYSIILYKDAAQFEFLLKSIYRTQNIYCIHVDRKSTPTFREQVDKISSCFDNVFLTSRSVDVTWGEFSVLEPEIICLNELWSKSIKWKYFINLTGQEIPLRTNYELVKILTSFDGANNVEAVRLSQDRLSRAGAPPTGVVPRKGALHVVLSRDFVDFLLHNETAIEILEWSKKVDIPDEIFFSTLNYNEELAAPGSFRGEAQTTNDTNPFFGRLKNWKTESHCSGKFVRDICIFGGKDLPLLATREELFANKVYFDYHPEVAICMQELIYNRTADEYNGYLDFNVDYYTSRDFVKNKFPSSTYNNR